MTTTGTPFIMLDDEDSAGPLHRQIYEAIRRPILRGELRPRTRLPSTRRLAEQLGVSRMTVVNAYDQLLAEGYVEGRTGAGTFVAAELPEEMLRVGEVRPPRRGRPSGPRPDALSRRGRWLASASLAALRMLADGDRLTFQNGLPAIDEFPFRVWSKLAARRLRNPSRELLRGGDPAGYLPLREAVAAHLKSARAVNCDADQVVIVSGSQQAFDLAARIFVDPGTAVWVEDPCYLGARNALLSAGAEVVPVPVDGEGLDPSGGLKRHSGARLVFVTPSHQFPLGVTMSLSRRLALLEWASRAGAFVIEDDYDSEYRYAGRPLASLQGLDREGRVIYVGTFSKTIFPSLRLGCVVAPKGLTQAFVAARALADRQSPSLDQAVLADFINEGHFARHMRRMRALYAERQRVLVEAARRDLQGLLEVEPAEAGMHLVGWLPEGLSDVEASQKAARHGVDVSPLSVYSVRPLPRGGLVLGYTSADARQIREGVRRLAKALS